MEEITRNLEKIKCDLCGADHFETVYERSDDKNKALTYSISENKINKPEKIVKCLRCNLKYCNPRSNQEELLQSYESMTDEIYVKEFAQRSLTAKEIVKKIDKLVKHKGTFLDIGCSCGFLLSEAKTSGWETYGVEPSKWASDYARLELGLENIINKDLFGANLPDQFFDVVVMTDVIEHLTSPKQYLKEIKRILKPDGILYVTTPNADSLMSLILGQKWWGINSFHLYYFTKKTLLELLKSTGFSAFQTDHPGRFFSLDYLIYRLQDFNKFLEKSVLFFSNVFSLKEKNIKVNFYDQIGIFARKTRDIKFVKEKEEYEKNLQDSVVTKKAKVIAVLPAYNAEKTLQLTVDDIPRDVVDEIILVDDCSKDKTFELAKELGLGAIKHEKNLGYGGNQKTCYKEALKRGADVVVMVHPDYQYDPCVIKEMVEPIINKKADVVFASRMMKGGALEGGMPLWKHNVNIILTAISNIIFKTYLTEYHSGFRAFSRDVIENINLESNKNNFVFDFEMIAQIINKNYKIKEIPIQTRYFDGASSIKIIPAMIYGCGILFNLFKYYLHKKISINFKQFR